MRNGSSTTSAFAPATPGPLARLRIAPARDASRVIRRIRRAWHSPPPLPTMEEVEERLRGYRGFFASLTPEQWAAIEAYDGPEVFGNPNGPKRTF